MNVDLMASVRASHAALPFLEKTQGSIVHISSISGLTSSARTPPYGAVKAALIQYTKSQASVLAAKKIRVNCVAPGSIEFPGGVWDMARQTIRSCMPVSSPVFRSVEWGRPRKSPRWCCSSLVMQHVGLPGKPWRSTAGSCCRDMIQKLRRTVVSVRALLATAGPFLLLTLGLSVAGLLAC